MQAPQGIASDRQGNIWIVNCYSKDVTKIPNGNFGDIRNYFLLDDQGMPILKHAFDIAIDDRGHAWVTSNQNSRVIELGQDGILIGEPVTKASGIDFPMGIATDSQGNLWVSNAGNAGIISPPCSGGDGSFKDPSSEIGPDGAENTGASVTLIKPGDIGGENRKVITFDKIDGRRNGLRWPWGIAVDGADNVWVSNFTGQRLMQLCGVKPENCGPNAKTGDPVSLDEGYFSDALTRVTAVQIDPSGNLWATNNWILDGFTHMANPGGHQVVVFIGLAKPIHTPLIGPPQQPGCCPG